ncbi:MAG: hypothetical protein P8X96_00580 [Desulfobacteraceae bacterium]
MKAMIVGVLFLLFLNVVPADAFDLATEISQNDGSVILSSMGYAKLHLIKLDTHSKGIINLKGTLSIDGKGNIVLWAKVDGRYYFSKAPRLNNIQDQKGVHFSIPFNSAEKTITEVVLEVELLQGGRVEISDISLHNR